MKKTISLTLIALVSVSVFAQKKKDDGKPKVYKNWYFKKPSSKNYGIDVDGAYKLLAGKKSTPIIVCVLDGGTQPDHPDLKSVIWKNKGEIPNNNIDDDKNGYVDDTCGWNFIGGKDTNVRYDNYEWVREYAKLRTIYDDADCDDFGGDEAKQKECEKCQKYKADIKKNVDEAKAQEDQVKEFITAAKSIKKRTGKEDPTLDDLKGITAKTNEEQLILMFSKKFISKGLKYNELVKIFESQLDGINVKVKYQYNPDYDSRTIVGDNYANSSERYYGNNNVEGPEGSHGSHVAGIIGATRNNKLGMDGIADNVQIMVVRVVPDGDERDKDVANGIRYAVDNGAKIINMSFGKDVSYDKNAVDSAVMYAESKGVLLIHAAGNSSQDNDVALNYPNDSMRANESFAPNWIEVGASGTETKALAASFSNYGKNNVDVFAPGVEIWSTTPKGQYSNFQGTSMASPVCAGVAALVWSYFPTLTYAEVKDIILKSAKPVEKVVPMPSESGNGKDPVMVNFTSLSVTGGVINAKEAVKLAMAKTQGK